MEIILASGSPRRADLLRELGVDPVISPPDIDETQRKGEGAAELAERLACEKSAAVNAADEGLVIAADTIVVVDGDVLGKPADTEEAHRFLRRLSGRSHDVITGVAVRCGDQLRSAAEVTQVEMAPLTDAQIDWYVTTGEPADKAGAYAMQGIAGAFVTRIEGSFDNVIGLPRHRLLQLAADLGVDLLASRAN